MEEVKFILLKKLEKLNTAQWLWIVAAIVLLGAAAVWLVQHRAAEKKKSARIIAIGALCCIGVIFLLQMGMIMALSGMDAAALDPGIISLSASEGAEGVTVELEPLTTPKQGDRYRPGEKVKYAIKLTNTGAAPVTALKVEDGLAWEEWEIESIAPGAAQTLESGAMVEYDSAVIPNWLNYLMAALMIVAGIVLFTAGLAQSAAGQPAAAQKADVRALTYGALCMAMSFVLSYIKFFSVPGGGSVTLASMLPLLWYSNKFGLRNGLIAGAAYGLLQFIQKPEIYHWVQVLLDYPLAFMMLGLAGSVKKLQPGIVLGIAGRWICHLLSGAVFFASWMPADWSNPWIWSAATNGGYLLVELVLSIILSFALAKTLDRIPTGRK